MFFSLLIVFGPLLGICSLRIGLGLGSRILSLVMGVRSSVEAWYTTALDIEVLSGVVDSDVFFDMVDRGILDKVLSSFGLPGWVRNA